MLHEITPNFHQHEYPPNSVLENNKKNNGLTSDNLVSIEMKKQNEDTSPPSFHSRIILPFLSWFKDISTAKPPEKNQYYPGYPTDPLLQQAEAISTELNHKLMPTIQLPFSLKGKKRIVMGMGILAGAAGSSLAIANYTRNTPASPNQALQPTVDDHPTPHRNLVNTPYIPPFLQSENLILESAQIPNKEEKKQSVEIMKSQKRLVQFLKNKGMLSQQITDNKGLLCKEMLIEGVAQYLYQDSVSSVKRSVRLARNILSAEDLYGSRKGETLSPQLAKKVISRWLFDNTLGTVVAEYVARKISNAEYPHYFTVSSLRKLLSLNTLFGDGLVNYASISANGWGDFNRLWYDSLEHEIPLFKLPEEKVDGILLNSQEFIELYSGSVLLTNNNTRLNDFPISDICLTGKKAWGLAISNELEINNLSVLLLPVLIRSASNNTFSPTEKNNRFITYIHEVNDYIQELNKLLTLTQESIDKFESYKKEITRWIPKKKLADAIIAECHALELPLPAVNTDSAKAINSILIKKVESAPDPQVVKDYLSQQIYLDDFNKPCNQAPDNLDDEYRNLTSGVANKFFDFDKALISLILSNAPPNEKSFIYSKNKKIRSVYFSLDTLIPNCFYDSKTCSISIPLVRTDLFSIMVGTEERIYALKNMSQKNTPSYELIRVDHNIRKYMDNDLIGFTSPVTEYQVTDALHIDNERYEVIIKPQDNHIETPEGENNPVAHYLATLHRDSFYNELHAQGNDKSDLQKIVSVIKHVIPFYDCIEASVEGNVADAVPACLLDIISLIPVAGLATRMGITFSKSLGKGIAAGSRIAAQGGLKNMARAAVKEIRLPVANEFIQLGKNALRSIDPGFELIGSGAKLVEGNVAALVRKKGSLPQRQACTMALMPDSTLEVPVQRLTNRHGEPTYVMVNPATGELFGKHYRLVDENKLALFKNNIYPQKSRPVMNRMDQELLIVNYDQHIVDISHIPAENAFLPSADYSPLHMQLGLAPNIDVSIQPHLLNDFTHSAVNIKNYIIENYARNDIFLCRFNQPLQEIPPAFANLRNNIEQYKSEIRLAKQQINNLRHEIRTTTMRNANNQLTFPVTRHRIANYLSKVLHLDTLEDSHLAYKIKREALDRIDFHTRKISEYLNNEINNIYFASADTIHHPYLHSPDCAMGFVYKLDDFRRVIIMADNFHTAPILSTKVHLTALHEISHFSGSFDFQIAPSTSLVGDASEFMESFLDGIHGIKGESIDIPDSFLNYYHQAHPDRSINKLQFIELLKVDPMLRANIFMENADFLARLIADLGSRTPVNHDVLHRRKRAESENNALIIKILLQLLA